MAGSLSAGPKHQVVAAARCLGLSVTWFLCLIRLHRLMTMANLTVSTHVQDGLLVLRLDDEMILEGSGVYDEELREGAHVLQWYVKGIPSTSFALSISSPALAEFQISKKLPLSGRDFGGLELLVK